MPLACPACGQNIQTEHVNVAADLAKCAACGEVFRPSGMLAASPASPPAQPDPERPADLPEGSKVTFEEFGGLTVKFPPLGFHFSLLFLAAFAVAWWSFLIVFVGVGIYGMFGSEAAEGEHGKAATFGGIFMLLFMTPFFLAGFGMLFGILWPLFGRTQFACDGMECTYRASLFGIGRTRRAKVHESMLRWLETGVAAESYGKSEGSTWGSRAHLLLTLGRREKPIAGHLSRLEQAWVYHLMRDYLERCRV